MTIGRQQFNSLEIELPKVKGEWPEFYENIAQVLNGKAQPIVTMPQILRVMNVVDAIFESQRTGAAVKTRI